MGESIMGTKYWQAIYDYLHQAEIKLVRILREPANSADERQWRAWREKIKQKLDELRELRTELEDW